MVRSRFRRILSPGLLSLLIYFTFALLFFGRTLGGQFTTFYFGRDTDPSMFMWYLAWWPYAISHGLNPFFTKLVWVPQGFNLAWSTFVPLAAWITIPIERALGPLAAYNTLCLIAPPLAAYSAFVLCRYLGARFWPSVLGGYIFGFSPYMLGQSMSHLHLILVFPVPLLVFVAVRRLRADLSSRRFVILSAALLIAQFLFAIEVFATMTLFAAIAIALALWFSPPEERRRLFALSELLVASYAISALVLSPYLYHLFAFGFPNRPIWPLEKYSADLINLFVPTTTNEIGTIGWMRAVSARFPGNLFEAGAYLGVPLLVIAEVWRRSYWKTPAGKLLISMLAIVSVAAMGPVLHVMGRPLIPMPWALAARLPLIQSALPVRFSLYAFLVLAVVAALWFSTTRLRAPAKLAAAGLVILFMAPNLKASFWTRPANVPAFFADGEYRNHLSPGEVILPLPFGQKGTSMLWQAESGMYFRMASGWTGLIPFEFDRTPIVRFFLGAIDLPEAGEQLKAFIARHGVTAVVLDDRAPHREQWTPVLARLGVQPAHLAGVTLYRIPAGAFAPYAAVSEQQMEARAVALRFDTLIRAVHVYVKGRPEFADLSMLKLKQERLLPEDWIVDPDPESFKDVWAGPIPPHRIGIGVVASAQAVRPLIERYRVGAAEAYYPYPDRWSQRSGDPNAKGYWRGLTSRRTLRRPIDLMVMVFDRHQLAAVAERLDSSPPAELTRPFVPEGSQREVFR